MRNLKRVLSLSLASIMLLGMMVIGSSAVDYSDVYYDNDNVEAIEVLDAINVMRGDLDANGNLAGTFRPGSEVKRSEMARIMAFLMDLDYDYYVGANPFTDMNGHWAEGYAAACAANGIIYGRTNTTYDPDATVTAVEAAAILMRGLGYFQNPAVDQPDGFIISTVRQAGKINLFNKVDVKTEEPMTRNDVAQLVLNALQSGMVEPSNNNKIDVTVGDAQVSIGSSNYVYTVARDPAVGSAINDTKAERGNSSTGLEGEILDLGEKLYNGKLRLHKYEIDAFDRPSRQWEFDGKEIGTYVKDELFRQDYTVKVTGKTLYDLIGAATLRDYNVNIYVDGISVDETNAATILGDAHFTRDALVRNNDAKVGETDKGVLTEVYVDSSRDDPQVDIVIINTYLAIAANDYREKTDDVTLTVYGIDNKGTAASPLYVKSRTTKEDKESIRVPGEDFDIVKDIEEDDLYLVNVARGSVEVIRIPELVSDTTISAFKKGTYVVSDGAQYDYASTAEYDWEVLDEWTSVSGTENLKDRLYNLIMDYNGYVIGVELVEDNKNYAFLTGIDTNRSNITNKTADVNLIFLDGTSQVVTVDLTKSKDGAGKVGGLLDLLDTLDESAGEYAVINTWVTYTQSTSGVYTLSQVADEINTPKKIRIAQTNSENTALTIDKKNNSLPGDSSTYANVYGNNESIYLHAKLDAVRYATIEGTGKYAVVITEASNTTVGIDNVDMTSYEEDDVRSLNDKSAGYDEDGNLEAVSSGVYTLYNHKGYVIAAMAVGKDNSARNNLIYVHTNDIEKESYASNKTKAADGEWEWVRKVIDCGTGEEIMLTEAGDSLTYINKLEKDHVYTVRYNANGEVTGTSDVSGLNSDLDTGAYVTNPIELPPAYRAHKTVVFQYTYDTTYNRPHLEGQTLFVTGLSDTGVRVADDVQTTMFQTTSNTEKTYNGYNDSDLKKFIDELNKAENIDHNFLLTLVVLDGSVRFAVIRDNIKEGYKPGASSTGGLGVTINFNQMTVTGIKYTGNAAHDEATIVDAIIAELEANGYTVEKVGYNSGTYTFTTVKNGIERPFTWNANSETATEYVNVTVNGTATKIKAESQTAGTVAATANVASSSRGTYVKQETTDDNGKAVTNWIAVPSGNVDPKEGDKFTFGYYAITVKPDKITAPGNGGGNIYAALKSPTYTDANGKYLFVKAGKTQVVITVDYDSTITSDGIGITSDNGTVIAGGHIEAGDAGSATVTVELTVTSTDVEITLSAANYTAPKYLKINGTTYDANTIQTVLGLSASYTYEDIGKALDLKPSVIGTYVQITKNKVTSWQAVSTDAYQNTYQLDEGFVVLFDGFISEGGLKEGEAKANVDAVKKNVTSAKGNTQAQVFIAKYSGNYNNVAVKIDESLSSENDYALVVQDEITLSASADKHHFNTLWSFPAEKTSDEYVMIPFILDIPKGAMAYTFMDPPSTGNATVAANGDDLDGDGVKDHLLMGYLIKVAGGSENTVGDDYYGLEKYITWYADEARTVQMGDPIHYTMLIPKTAIKPAAN